MKSPPHPTVIASNGIPIDEKIHPLMEALWAAGVETRFCCQDFGGPRSGGRPGVGSAYIKFASDADAARFSASLSRFYREELFVDFPAADLPAVTAHWQAEMSPPVL